MLSHALTFGIPHLDVPDVEGTHPGLYGAQVADHDDRGWLELQHPRRRGVAVHWTDRREPFTIAGVEVSGQPCRDPSRARSRSPCAVCTRLGKPATSAFNARWNSNAGIVSRMMRRRSPNASTSAESANRRRDALGRTRVGAPSARRAAHG